MIGKFRVRRARPVEKAVAALLFAIGMTACGGGGGGGDSSGTGSAESGAQATQPPASSPLSLSTLARDEATAGPGRLLLSEVATNYYSNDLAWFEVHNPGGLAVPLARYTLRSSFIDHDTGANSTVPIDFALPDVLVPAGAYLVIAARISERLRDNAQMVYVSNGNAVPFWNANGSIELIADGVTADFVRFGNSTAAPVTVSEWVGSNVPAMPAGPDEHGKSIVRPHANRADDSNTAADWKLVNFATPAGINDVPANVVDSDRDGIPDSAKVSGGTYAGLDLHAMGALPGRRDIFIEVDYMNGSDVATVPRREALQKMERAFAARGIALHIDAGRLYAADFDAARFNLGGGNAVDFTPCIELDTLDASVGLRAGCASFQEYKNANFDVRRRLVFHYALFANSLKSDGSAGPSGIAEMSGNDLIITLGGYDFSTTSPTGLNMLINMQAGALMHEFGHNLGLRHGGNEDVNFKPNHFSVMNYMYQFTGLTSAPNSTHAAERYYLANGLKGLTYCGLTENSPCTDAFTMDYSNGSSAAIDESSLSEAANIGRGAVAGAYADWDDNSRLTDTSFARNINPQDGYGRSVLRDYDEWSNLSIAFARNHTGSSSGRSLTPAPARINPMRDDHPHRRIDEEPLPPQLHKLIRDARGAQH